MEPQVDCIDNVEYSEKFKTVTITFTDGSSQVLNKPSAHDLFIELGEILGIDWHS